MRTAERGDGMGHPRGAGAGDGGRAASPDPGFRLGHRPALDGFRGVAILLVVLYNFHLGLGGGYIGVDMFFVLSGFLITSLLLAEQHRFGRIDFPAFYLRRALRLLPALVFLLLVYCGVATLLKGPTEARGEYLSSLAALFYVGNWVLATGRGAHVELMGSLAHTWSLSVEEQFYLVWPPILALLLALGSGIKRVGIAAATGVVLAAAWRAFLSYSGGHPLRIYAGTDTRADAILLGCLLAVLFTISGNRGNSPETRDGGGHPDRRAPSATVGFLLPGVSLAFLLAGAILFPEGGHWMEAGGFLAVGLASSVLLGSLVAFPEGLVSRAFRWRPLVLLGKVSYGVYLWHVVIGSFLNEERTGLHSVGLAFLRLVVTAGVVAFSWVVIERPALGLKRRWGRPRAKEASALNPARALE